MKGDVAQHYEVYAVEDGERSAVKFSDFPDAFSAQRAALRYLAQGVCQRIQVVHVVETVLNDFG